MLTVTFYGVRGSTPCPCAANLRYGGNTACVAIEAPGQEPIVLDLGTGLRSFGESLPADLPFRGSALVTHLHWDHIQGLPFFAPILRPGSRLDVYGPAEGDMGLAEAFAQLMRPPFFPVRVEELLGEVTFHDAPIGTFSIGDADITVGKVPHVGTTNGYRIESAGASVAYVSDHQQPRSEPWEIADSVIELCHGVDLLIHDAQYDAEEFEAKSDWGHCTPEFAVAVGAAAGVRRLALFHHDPSHDDDALDELAARARRAAVGTSIEEVLIAYEGLSVALGQSTPRVAPAESQAVNA